MYRELRTWVVVSRSWRSVAVMNLVVNLKEQFEKYLRVFYKYVYWKEPYKTFWLRTIICDWFCRSAFVLKKWRGLPSRLTICMVRSANLEAFPECPGFPSAVKHSLSVSYLVSVKPNISS